MRKKDIPLTVCLLLSMLALASCKVAVLGRVDLACDATGMAAASFKWTPADDQSAIQYLDISLFDTFPEGLFLGAGPIPATQSEYAWGGLMPGTPHYWRVNTLVNGNWYTSATGSFTTPCVQERSEYELAQGINHIRAENGLPPLVLDPRLTTIANFRAMDMANKGYFSHDPPDGCDYRCLLTRAGIAMSWTGEIIAWNNYPADQDQRIDDALRRWQNSPGHFAVITNPNFEKFGVGFAVTSSGYSYEVGVFLSEPAAVPTPSATPTPMREPARTRTPRR